MVILPCSELLTTVARPLILLVLWCPFWCLKALVQMFQGKLEKTWWSRWFHFWVHYPHVRTCAAPVIMFGMKSLCPGASIRVTTFESVSNFVMPTSIVTPLWKRADDEQMKLGLGQIFQKRKWHLNVFALNQPVSFLSCLIQYPRIGERGFASFLGLLLIFMHGSLINVPQQIQQMTHESALTSIYMTYTHKTQQFKFHIHNIYKIYMWLKGRLIEFYSFLTSLT